MFEGEILRKARSATANFPMVNRVFVKMDDVRRNLRSRF